MNKHKNYHLYGILTIVILILLVIFLSLFASRKSTTGNSSSHNNSSGTQALSPSSSPGTDIIKDEEDDADISAYLEEQDTIISDMLAGMSVKESGSAEFDFLIGMIPHHEASVELSKNYILFGGENKELKKLASNIIDNETEEIEEMRQLIKEIQKQGISDKKNEKNYLKFYNKMISSHQHIGNETESSSNVEEAYIEGMVIHHQMAIDMSDTILRYSNHKEIRSIAKNIIETNKNEITQMEEIFNDM